MVLTINICAGVGAPLMIALQAKIITAARVIWGGASAAAERIQGEIDAVATLTKRPRGTSLATTDTGTTHTTRPRGANVATTSAAGGVTV